MRLLTNPIYALGKIVLDTIQELGGFFLFAFKAFVDIFKTPLRLDLIIKSIFFIGNKSVLILIVSAFSIGAAFSIQVGAVFKIFTAESMIGVVTGISFSRELASLLTGSLLAGRAGSAITAEISTMKITEQIDAMEAMGVDPINHLVKPRLIAAIIVTPFLNLLFIVVAVFSSYFLATSIFGVDKGVFISKTFQMMNGVDLWKGLQKAFAYSMIFPLVACWYGLKCKGGAKGVGKATTTAVIVSLLGMLVVDFIITYIQLS